MTFAARIGKVGLHVGVVEDRPTKIPRSRRALDASLAKVVAGAALEAATMARIAAIVERATASTFSYLFGVAPEPPPKEKQKE